MEFLGTFANRLRSVLYSFDMSVCLSVRASVSKSIRVEQLDCCRTDSHENWHHGFLLYLVDTYQFWSNSDKNNIELYTHLLQLWLLRLSWLPTLPVCLWLLLLHLLPWLVYHDFLITGFTNVLWFVWLIESARSVSLFRLSLPLPSVPSTRDIYFRKGAYKCTCMLRNWNSNEVP